MAVFHLLDDKGVMHIHTRAIILGAVGFADGLGFKLINEQVGYNGIGGNPWLQLVPVHNTNPG